MHFFRFSTRLLLSTMSFSINVQLFQTHKVPSKSGNKLKLSTSGYITFIHPLKTFFIHKAMSASVCGCTDVIYPPCFFRVLIRENQVRVVSVVCREILLSSTSRSLSLTESVHVPASVQMLVV